VDEEVSDSVDPLTLDFALKFRENAKKAKKEAKKARQKRKEEEEEEKELREEMEAEKKRAEEERRKREEEEKQKMEGTLVETVNKEGRYLEQPQPQTAADVAAAAGEDQAAPLKMNSEDREMRFPDDDDAIVVAS